MKLLLIVLFAGMAFGQAPVATDNSGTSSFALATNAPMMLWAGKVRINMVTGRITFSEDVTPDEAAKSFAEALIKAWPYACNARISAPFWQAVAKALP